MTSVSPGRERSATVPPWAVHDGLDQGRARARRRPCRLGCGPRRRGRTARRRARPGRAGSRGRRRARTKPPGVGGDGDRRAGRGVLAGVGEQVGHHLVQPLYVAVDLDRLLGQVELPAVPGVDDPRVGDRLDQQPGQVDRRAARAAGRSRAGPAAAGPRPSRSSVRTPPRPCRARSAMVAGVVGTYAGPARCSRRWWSAASAARGRRPRRTGAPAARCSCRAVSDDSTWASRVLSADADLADLGVLVGEPVRHPLGELDVTGRQGQLGDVVGGGGDLAQRSQLTAYEDGAGTRGRHDPEHADEHLPEDELRDRAVDRRRGEPDDDDPVGDLSGPPRGTRRGRRRARRARTGPGGAR